MNSKVTIWSILFLVSIFFVADKAHAQNVGAACNGNPDCTSSCCLAGYCSAASSCAAATTPASTGTSCSGMCATSAQCAAIGTPSSGTCPAADEVCCVATAGANGTQGGTCGINSDCVSSCCLNGYCAAASSCGASTAGGTGTPTGGTTTPTGGVAPNGTTTPTGGTAPSALTNSGVVIPTNTGLANPSGGIKAILTNLLTWLLGVVGIIAIIGFVISGIQYIMSAGDEKIIETAKRNMLYSIIGVIVVLASFVIIQAIDFALRAQSF